MHVHISGEIGVFLFLVQWFVIFLHRGVGQGTSAHGTFFSSAPAFHPGLGDLAAFSQFVIKGRSVIVPPE